MSAEHHNDTGAAFTGLIVTAVAIAALAFGIVMMTNAKYAAKEGSAAETTTAH